MVTSRNAVAFVNIHPQKSKWVTAKIILVSPASILVGDVNDYKGNGISGRDRYIFCSSVMLGTACTALFVQTLICLILGRGKLTL